MTHRPRRRAAYTLLELILAMLIGMLLMLALYVMLSAQLTNAQKGRDSIREATVVRAILATIADDIAVSLGTYDPQKSVASSSSGTNSAMASQATASTTPPFNYGIEGDDSTLTLNISPVPREQLAPDKLRLDTTTVPTVSGLRRTTYWVVEGLGLLKYERTDVTNSDLDNWFPDQDQAKRIAPEVKSISFQYWDGTQWTQNWTSYDPTSDSPPLGPPAGIEITITMNPTQEGQEGRSYRHVVSIPTGNNYSVQSQ